MTEAYPGTGPAAAARLYLLGPFRLEVAGQGVALPTRKAEALLAFLALHPEPAGHSRERLAARFWGDATDSDARRSLRVALAALRRALGRDPFTGDRATVGLDPAYPLWVDALAFQDLARRFLAGGADALAGQCAALYRGDLLADYYDEWLPLPRDRLRGRYQQTLLALAERHRARGAYAAAAEAARRLLALDPADEAAHQQLMFFHLAQGNRAAALQQYETCARVLCEELAVPPSPETEALRDWIKTSAAPPKRPAAARRGNVPLPLAGIIGRQDALADIEHWLFAPSGHPRLVTLTGAGGNGKTRLAQEVGHSLADRFRDGAWWVDLTPLADGAQVAAAAAGALGLAGMPGRAPEDALAEHLAGRQVLLILDNCEHLVAAAAGLVAHLLGRCPELRVLATSREPLHIPGEQTCPVPPLPAPPDGRNLPPQTLDQYPAVALLVARAASHRPGFRLTPENGPLIAHICRRLDGIPLAIELAAARLKTLSVHQVAERLDDRFRLLRGGARTAWPRQQTLQALIDWSYDLLGPEEQAMLRLLAVFAGGWTLDAAEAVWAAARGSQQDERAPQGLEAADLLERLADKSLIVVSEEPDGARYNFLETILAYARQRLADPAEADAAERAHLAHFLRLAEEAETNLRGPAIFSWLARLAHEHDNLVAALAHALQPAAANPRREAGMRLAAALEAYWYMRGHAPEGRRWLAAALALAPDDAPAALLARTHAAAGTMAWLGADYSAAEAHHQTAFEGYRALGDFRGAAWALGNLAVCANDRGEHGRALALYAEAAELARRASAAWEEALILNNWSAALIDLGQIEAALPRLERSVALLNGVDDAWAASHPALNLVEIAIERGEWGRAAQLLDEMAGVARRLDSGTLGSAVDLRRGVLSLRQARPAAAAEHFRASLRGYAQMADRAEALNALEGLAQALAATGAERHAAHLLAAAEWGRAALGAARQPAEAQRVAGCLAQVRERLGAAALHAIQAAARRLTLEDAIAGALSEPAI